jgi:hypothetical protein
VELSLLDAGYGALVLAERPGHLGLSQARSLGGSSQSSAHDPSHANRGLWRALILCMTAVTVTVGTSSTSTAAKAAATAKIARST